MAAGTNSRSPSARSSIGLFANAQSLVADAFHTLSDLLADALVMFANRRGAQPADEDYPLRPRTHRTRHPRLRPSGSRWWWSVRASWRQPGLRLQQGGRRWCAPARAGMALATLAAKRPVPGFMLNVGREMRLPMLKPMPGMRVRCGLLLVVARRNRRKPARFSYSSRWLPQSSAS